MPEYELGNDRAVIYFDGHGPVALEDLTDSFAALARIYERRFEPSKDGTTPRLYVSRLSSGSIEAEIVPLLMIVGSIIPYMDAAIIVREFTRWIGGNIKHFAGLSAELPPSQIAREDASDLREFIKPIAGRRGAQLGLRHARYSEKTERREMIAEFEFEESAINRASVNLERHVEDLDERAKAPELDPKLRQEVLMVWHQTSREPGKERGHTGDRAVIEAVTEKPLKVYFPKQANDLKRRMTREEAYPFARASEPPRVCRRLVCVSHATIRSWTPARTYRLRPWCDSLV